MKQAGMEVSCETANLLAVLTDLVILGQAPFLCRPLSTSLSPNAILFPCGN